MMSDLILNFEYLAYTGFEKLAKDLDASHGVSVLQQLESTFHPIMYSRACGCQDCKKAYTVRCEEQSVHGRVFRTARSYASRMGLNYTLATYGQEAQNHQDVYLSNLHQALATTDKTIETDRRREISLEYLRACGGQGTFKTNIISDISTASGNWALVQASRAAAETRRQNLPGCSIITSPVIFLTMHIGHWVFGEFGLRHFWEVFSALRCDLDSVDDNFGGALHVIMDRIPHGQHELQLSDADFKPFYSWRDCIHEHLMAGADPLLRFKGKTAIEVGLQRLQKRKTFDTQNGRRPCKDHYIHLMRAILVLHSHNEKDRKNWEYEKPFVDSAMKEIEELWRESQEACITPFIDRIWRWLIENGLVDGTAY